MTARQLLEAFGEIEETYIEAAAHQMQKRKKNRRARWGAAAAAAMLILTGAFGTAMAVNASFRQKVLSFFHINQAESVPEEGSEGAGISQSDIGGLVKAEYIRLEEGARYETGFGTLNQVDRAERTGPPFRWIRKKNLLRRHGKAGRFRGRFSGACLTGRSLFMAMGRRVRTASDGMQALSPAAQIRRFSI